MKIVITVDEGDYSVSEEMLIDGKRGPSVGPLCECPEDAIIGRSLISCTEISEYMKMAHEAGNRGEPFDVEIIEEEGVEG